MSRNIADVLEAGFFPTSRARSRNPDDSSSGDDDTSHPRARRAATTYEPYEPYKTYPPYEPYECTQNDDSLPPPPQPPPHGLSSSPPNTSSHPPLYHDAPYALPSRRQTTRDMSSSVSDHIQHPSHHHLHHPSHAHSQSRTFGHKSSHPHDPSNSTPRQYPPCPSVEDEADSLAREHNVDLYTLHPGPDEEIPSKGDFEQNPILMEVHEHNPERRFVLLSPNDDEPLKSPTLGKPPSTNEEQYEANTSRKYDPPTVTTDFSTAAAAAAAGVIGAAAAAAATSSPRSGRRSPGSSGSVNDREPQKRTRVRSQSSAQVEQQQKPPESSGVKKAPPIDTSYLGPEVVKQGVGGREKSYYDYGRGPNGTSATNSRTLASETPRSRSTYADRQPRNDDSASLSPPVGGRRSQSSVEGSGAKIDRYTEMTTGLLREPGLPPNRSGSMCVRSGRSREPRRDSPPRPEDDPSSDESSGKTLRPPSMLLRKATMDIGDGESEFGNPDDVVPPMPSRIRGRTPTMPAGRVPFPEDAASPRHSMPSLPIMTEDRRRDDMAYPDDESPHGGGGQASARPPVPTRTRSRSRAPTMRASTTAIQIPMSTNSPAASPIDGRKSGHPITLPPIDTRSPIMSSSPPTEGWQPGVFDPEHDKLSADRPQGAYRRYSEDMSKTRLPDCRRKKPVAGKKDWMTLEQCNMFNICPTCYDGLFKNSLYAVDFIPVARPTELAIACDFGSIPWYRIAWLLNLKNHRSDLAPFHWVTATVKNAVLKGESCPGERQATRMWYTIKNPETGDLIPNFDICYGCASCIEILLPSLKNVFVPVSPASEPTRSMCAMRFKEDRKRFVQYFDSMEMITDRAALNPGGILSETDLIQLAKSLDRLSSFVECLEDTPIIDGGWHVMQHLPVLTVCGDCFDDVVRPQLEQGSTLARQFYINAQRRPTLTTCQLYSDRMREVFVKACRKTDMAYLERRVKERREVEESIRSKLDRLSKEVKRERERGREREAKRHEERMEQLIKEWKKWE